jgi:hypothetical protein
MCHNANLNTNSVLCEKTVPGDTPGTSLASIASKLVGDGRGGGTFKLNEKTNTTQTTQIHTNNKYIIHTVRHHTVRVVSYW